MQTTIVKPLGQFVFGKREMVHPDWYIARIHKTFDGDSEQRELVWPLGQVGLVDLHLIRFHPGNVRIGIDRQAIGGARRLSARPPVCSSLLSAGGAGP